VLETETFSGEKLIFKGQKCSSNLLNGTVRELLASLESRFPPSELISATLIASFKNWPHLNDDQLKGLNCSLSVDSFMFPVYTV
jgi:hypothetical protein